MAEDHDYTRAVLAYCTYKQPLITRDSCRSIRNTLLRFGRGLGGKPLRSITPRDIERFLATKPAVSTRYTVFSHLKGFFGWCLKEGRTRNNPAVKVEIARRPKTAPRAIKAADAGLVLAATKNTRDRLIVTLMLQLGLRVREVAAIELGDIDWERRFTLDVKGKGGRGGVTRTIPVNEATARAIDAYLYDFPATAGPLIRSFTTGRGMSTHTLSNYVSEWFKVAGLKVKARDGRSAHALRHTCATDLVSRGAPVTVVQDLLGHENIATTQIYFRGHTPETRKWLEGREY